MRPEKQLLFEDIKARLVESKGFVLTRYHKMGPNLSAKFRGSLHLVGGDFEVVHKRIFVKVAAAVGHSIDRSSLDGHIGIVFANTDPLQITKSIFHFMKESEGVLDVVFAHLEGTFYSAEEVEYFSQLPSKEEMRGQFLHLLEAVPSQVLAVMEALLLSVSYCLDKKIKL